VPGTEASTHSVDLSWNASTSVVAGYNVEASDGVVGKVTDLLIDGRIWVIREIVVECGHWYAGKKVVVSTDKVSRIGHDQSTIYVDSTKHAFAEASEQPQGSPA
jgi:prephenate dehydratase